MWQSLTRQEVLGVMYACWRQTSQVQGTPPPHPRRRPIHPLITRSQPGTRHCGTSVCARQHMQASSGSTAFAVGQSPILLCLHSAGGRGSGGGGGGELCSIQRSCPFQFLIIIIIIIMYIVLCQHDRAHGPLQAYI